MWAPPTQGQLNLRISTSTHALSSSIRKDGARSPTVSSPGSSGRGSRLDQILSNMSILAKGQNRNKYERHAQALEQQKREHVARRTMANTHSVGRSGTINNNAAHSEPIRGIYSEDDLEEMTTHTYSTYMPRSSNSFSSDTDSSEIAWACRGCGTTDMSSLDTNPEGFEVCERCGVITNSGRMVSMHREKACAAEDDKTTRADAPSEGKRPIFSSGTVETAEEARLRRNREMGHTLVGRVASSGRHPRGVQSCNNVSDSDVPPDTRRSTSFDILNAYNRAMSSAVRARKEEEAEFELTVKIDNKMRHLQVQLHKVLNVVMPNGDERVAAYVRMNTGGILTSAMRHDATCASAKCNFDMIASSPARLAVAGTQFAFEQLMSFPTGSESPRLAAVAPGAHINAVRIPYNNLIEMKTSSNGMTHYNQLMAALVCISNAPNGIPPPECTDLVPNEPANDVNMQPPVLDTEVVANTNTEDRHFKIRDAIVSVATYMNIQHGQGIPIATKFMGLQTVFEWITNPEKCPLDESIIACILIKSAIARKVRNEKVESTINRFAEMAELSPTTVNDAYNLLIKLIQQDQNAASHVPENAPTDRPTTLF